jgi:hypothetical protein
MTKQEKNEIIACVNQHNERCMKVASMAFDYKCGEPNSQCVDTMIQGNIETGIKWCCIMREAGFDAIVDCVCGAVYSRSEVESIIDIMIDGKRRFNTFEFAKA